MKKIWMLAAILFAAKAMAQPEAQKKLQRLFIEAQNNSTITLPEGQFDLNASLWLDGLENVTIQGAGIDKTFLNFTNQVSGAEGVKVTNAKNITLADFTVQNTRGDGIKTQHVDGIIFRKVKAEWTSGPNKKNGGYGLYPVQCEHVLIEGCEATGASDAGIYVGQSNGVIVRNSRAWENVAGIEIENTTHADVYENDVYKNTGGILVFDLPDLIKKQGGFTRVYKNHIHDNNLKNFAPKGNIVAKVPAGTGILILATNHVEIFNNNILNNISLGTGIVSYYMTENPIKDSTYYPYPNQISIHDNLYKRNLVRPTSKGRLGKMFRFKLKFGKEVPHIIYDGIADEKSPLEICIWKNENESVANIKAADHFKNMVRDISVFACKPNPIEGVELKIKN